MKKCPDCGGDTSRITKISNEFCPECGWENRLKQTEKGFVRHDFKNCLNCGKKFDAKESWMKYCSAGCRDLSIVHDKKLSLSIQKKGGV